MPSTLRWRMELLLGKVGIDIARTTFRVSVTLPPREKAASLSSPP